MSADQPTLAELRDQRRSPTESQPTRPSWSVLIYAALAERGPLSTYKIANAIGLINSGQVLQRLRQLEYTGHIRRFDREDGSGGVWPRHRRKLRRPTDRNRGSARGDVRG